MAIQFARVEIIGRSGGRNALQKSAYNSRSKIKMEKAALLKGAYNSRGKTIGKGKVYNFSSRSDREHHEVILPEYVDRKFSDVSRLMNEVEVSENRKDSQLLKEVVLALPKEQSVGVEGRIEISRRFIERMGWVKEGLGVQLDIHRPHEKKDVNYHAHILVTTRRFRRDGKGLENKKARDLNPIFRSAKGSSFLVREEKMISQKFKEVQEEYFREKGLNIEVDSLSKYPQQHLGPVRFRTQGASKVIAINKELSRKGKLTRDSSALEIVKAFSERRLVFSESEMRYFMRKEGVADYDKYEEIFKLAEVGELRYYDNYQYSRGYRESGKYVLKEAWEQVERGMRNAEKIKSFQMKEIEYIGMGIDSYSRSYRLNRDQRKIYDKIARDRSGLKIMRGVAGSGKSRILGAIQDLYKSHLKVVGIAPTNKAVNELRNVHFSNLETVSGFLWKMEKGKMSLKRGSLVILDEGSMVSNNSYDRLLSICKDKGLLLIVSGDERQLSSIERGGIFDRLICAFDNLKLDRIVRQNNREDINVAEYLASGRIDLGVDELSRYGRIEYSRDEAESITQLVADWSKDRKLRESQLVIASRNREVEIINQEIHKVVLESYLERGGVRGIYKKSEGSYDVWMKEKIEEYVLGERVVFTGNKKESGIYNGDFGKIVKIWRQGIAVRLDRGDEIVRFDPKEFGNFTYGYASTIYKAQGASVERVYVFHNGYGNKKNSYVALTRHREFVKLYCNRVETKNNLELVNQLSSDREFCMSKSYRLPSLYEDKIVSLKRKEGRLAKYQIGLLSGIRSVRNWYSDNFRVESAPIFESKEVRVLEGRVEKDLGLNKNLAVKLEDKRGIEIIKDLVSKRSASEKERLVNENKVKNQINIENRKEKFQRAKLEDLREIRRVARDNIEKISREVFGSENRELSSAQVLKFGSKGKVAVHLSGEKRGLWYDFSKSEGGDTIKLLQKQYGLDFKKTVKYFKDRYSVGIAKKSVEKESKAIKKERINKLVKDQIKLESSYKRSNSLDEFGKSYFKNRGIKRVDLMDIRSGRNYDKETGKYFRSVVAFARNKQGEVRASQSIYLSERGGLVTKADISVSKRSFGTVKGAFVNLGELTGNQKIKKESVTHISEGIENGLSVMESVMESGVRGKFISSLGISNIRNYEAARGERIVLICDNDGANSNTNKVIEESKNILENKGAVVEILRPEKRGYDYNDVLRKQGLEVIRNDLAKSLDNLEDRYSAFKKVEEIDVFDKKNLRKINPEYSFVKLRDELSRGGKYYGEDVDKVLNLEMNRELNVYSKGLIENNRDLARGESLVSIGKVVLEEHKIMSNLREDLGISNIASLDLKLVQKLSESLDRCVEHNQSYKKIGLDILDRSGIEGLYLKSEKLCRNSVEDKIEKDLRRFEEEQKDYRVKDFSGSLIKDREAYVDSLLKDGDLQSMIENQKMVEIMGQQQRQQEINLRLT